MARYNYTGYAYLHYADKAVLVFINVDFSAYILQVWDSNSVMQDAIYRGTISDHPAVEIKPTRDTPLLCVLD